MDYIFRTPPGTVDREACARLASELDIPLLVARLLCQRGMTSPREARDFLYPRLGDLPSPLAMKGMAEAVDLVLHHYKRESPVLVHGDYDVDGISATVLLTTFLRRLGLEVSYHLPNRLREGYGINGASLRELAARMGSPALLITVDCGISAVEETVLARELGFDVIITDHHEPPPVLPAAQAILNPKQQDCTFPFAGLSGAGVAFFLVMAIRTRLVAEGVWSRETSPNLKEYLDLVALGTVADVMPLAEVNRILVRAGLEVLTARKRPGIWALCERIGLGSGRITAEDISYRLAPRLNAAGRLGRPEIAASLLLCPEVDQALTLADRLEEANNERRRLEAEVIAEAFADSETLADAGYQSLVIYGKQWHPGVIGIVASRVAARFQRPAIVFTDDTDPAPDRLKGSGRSIEGLNLYEALKQCTDLIEQYGGHAMAVGLTIRRQNLENFRGVLDSAVRANGILERTRRMVIDLCLAGDSSEIFSRRFIAAYQNLEPFGEGNPEPVFLAQGQRLDNISLVREHLKFTVRVNQGTIRGIGFGLGGRIDVAAGPVNLFFKLKNSSYRGREFLEVHAVNISTTD
ncbi:MAG TPA: single-stranded-DNA-specific exonuclease RecJ [Desulfobulbus sp.]|nr:single-stranded-DNA-specific exonuclease RecJ [Desulfobulbus sp.]